MKRIFTAVHQALLFVVTLLAMPLAAYAERFLLMYANHKGSEGLVRVGTNTVAELRGWQFSENAELIEDTVLTDGFKTFQVGNKGGSGSLTCWWDETDTNAQGAMTSGAEVTLNLYPEGMTTADVYYTGSAIINSVDRSAAINGIVEANFGFTFNGTIALSTAA